MEQFSSQLEYRLFVGDMDACVTSSPALAVLFLTALFDAYPFDVPRIEVAEV